MNLDLIETLARALCIAAGETPDQATPCHSTVNYVWQFYRSNAEAVLAALKQNGFVICEAEPIAVLGGINGVVLKRHINNFIETAQRDYDNCETLHRRIT
jgi:adenylate kinase